jgi:integrase
VIRLIRAQNKEILQCQKSLKYKLHLNQNSNSVTIIPQIEHSFIIWCDLLLIMPFTYLEDKEPGRRRSCLAANKLFLDHINGTKRENHGYIPKGEDEAYKQMALSYLADTNRDRVKDLITWRKQSTLAAKTCKVYAGCVKEFLENNGVVFDKKQLGKIKAAYKGGEEAPDDAPDHGKIRSFLEHGDVRIRAMALLLSSTGMRVGELLSIREKSIDFDRRMITLLAKDTKTNTGRVVFFTKEAERALSQWIKVKEKYITEKNIVVAAFGKNESKYDHSAVDDGRIFPYDPVSINRAWNRNLKHSGQFDKNDRGIVKFHPHSLRQFFSTQLRRNGCPDSVVEILLGHKPYLSTYIKYSPADLQEAYEKHSPALVIGSADDVRRTVNALAEKAIETNGLIKNLTEEKREIAEKYAALQERLQQLEETKRDTETVEAHLDEKIAAAVAAALKNQSLKK